MILSRPTFRFIFMRIPKTASSSMKQVLLPYMQKGYSIRTKFTNIKTLKNLACPKCTLSSYYKFSFVRNPFDRMVSYYEFNRAYYKRRNKEWPHKDLKAFVKAKGDWWQFKQYLWISSKVGRPVMNFIGRFENIKEDWPKVCHQIGIDPKPLPVMNKSKRRPYQEYYDSELIDIVSEICKRDLELFNYVF